MSYLDADLLITLTPTTRIVDKNTIFTTFEITDGSSHTMYRLEDEYRDALGYRVGNGTIIVRNSAEGWPSAGETITFIVEGKRSIAEGGDNIWRSTGVSGSISMAAISPDNTPNAFDLGGPVTVLNPNTFAYSNIITVSGTNSSTDILISGTGSPEYSINGKSFTSLPGSVINKDTVQVRVTSSENVSVTATLNIGGVTDTFSATVADSVPSTPSGPIITTDLQSQEVSSGLLELYELELSADTTLYFHPGVDESLSEIIYDGNTYIALPLIMSGMEANSDGATNRPELTIANVTTLFRATVNNEGFDFEDLIGKRITRRQILEKYLQNTTYEFPKKVYLLDRISSQNNVLVSFELSAPFDVSGIRLPNRVVVGKYCSWLYQGYDTARKGGCTWTETSTLNYDGTNYEAFFDVDDRPLIESGLVTFSAWVAGTYAIDAFVTHDGKKWRSQTDRKSKTPSSTNINWKEIFEWTNWSSATTYSIGAYVKSGNNIWKALRSSTNNTPVTGSLYWTRVDYCGKTLNSCKCRFQFTPVSGVASAVKETDEILPFGAFPGSVKFK